jgi:hypothetical protein
VSFIQYGFQTEAERAADQHRRDLEQQLKELAQWQGVIVGQLEQLIRGAPPDRIRARINEASREYGIRLKALLESGSSYQITGPSR